MYPGPEIGHGFGIVAGVLGAIVWALGSLILIAVFVALIVLLVRYLWFGTKASQRYLELNGQPTPRPRTAPAVPATSVAPAAPAAPAATAPTKPTPRPRTPRTPPAPPVA